MPAILHILTQPPDELIQALIRAQAEQPEVVLEVVDLTKPEPDYDRLVEKIFAAESLAVW